MLNATLFAIALHAAPVTVTIEPMPLRRAVPLLATAVGQKLAVANVLADEVVQVRATEVEPDRLLQQVAAVTGGVWADDGSGGRKLVEDIERTSRERREALQARTAMLAEELARLKKELDDNPNFDPERFRQQAGLRVERSPDGGDVRTEMRTGGPGMGFASMPGGRAAIRAVRGIAAAELAAIGEGHRVVYSSNPTPMQRRLPGNPMRDVETFLKEEQSLRSMMPEFPRGGRPGREGQRPEAPAQAPRVPAKSFLVVRRERDGLQLQYVVADTEGRSMGNGFLMVGAGEAWPMAAPGREREAGGAKAEYSKSAVEAARALGRPAFSGEMFTAVVSGGGAGADILFESEPASGTPEALSTPASLIERLQQPDKHDPLSLFAGEALALAAGEDDLVACIPDSALAPLAQAVARGSAPVADGLPYVLERKDGWALVRPSDLLRSRAERADRGALQALAGRVQADGVLRLKPLATYALTAPQLPGGVDSAVVRALDPSTRGRFDDVYGDGRAALRVFARLQGPDFSALASGLTKPVAGLGGASAGVADAVFHSYGGPSVERQERQENPGEGRRIEARVMVGGPGLRMMFGGGGDMRDERTEVLPRGLPGDTQLAMKASEAEVLYAYDPATGTGRYTTAANLGMEAAMREQFQRDRGPNRANERYAPTRQTEYVLTFLLAPGITLSHTLRDPAAADLKSAVGVNGLPSGLMAQYQQAYERAKERAGRIGQRGRGSAPPPAP